MQLSHVALRGFGLAQKRSLTTQELGKYLGFLADYAAILALLNFQ